MKPFSKKNLKKADFEEEPEKWPEEDTGSQPISKYHPAYEFLVALVKLITKEGVPPQEIKELASQYPFETVNDVGDLTAKIWSLATEKYNIPREWLIKKLNKYASLTKKADLWPAQEAAESMLSHDHNSLSYNPLQEADTSVSGPRPDDVEKVSKKITIDDVIKLLNAKEPQVANVNTKNRTIQLLDGTILSFEDAIQKALTLDKEGLFDGAEFSTTEFNVNPTLDNGPWSSPEDQGAKPQKSPFPNTNWLPADDENLDEQPWSNIASSLKTANPNTRYWIAPDGKEFPVSGIHPSWIKVNMPLLKQYGINTKNPGEASQQMLENGWVRVSNEPFGTGFQIEVNDVNNIPSFVDDFIAKNFNNGDTVLIGDGKSTGFKISDPFPSIQKAIRKNKRMGKQAAISGQIVNNILQGIHSSGGITYNLSQGNLTGTPTYAVSIYPDRELIVNGVDFDILEGYIEQNEDLLSDANNSFGAWSHEGKVYLDVVQVVPDRDKAIELAKQHNQLAVFDLQNNQEISTGLVRAFSKKNLIKTAEEPTLPQAYQNEIAAASSPVYVIAVNRYMESVKNGHEPQRSFDYAVESVKNLEEIDPNKLKEFIDTYVN